MMQEDENAPSVFMGGNQAFNKGEAYKFAVDADRPEFQIKNLSDYKKKKRADKEQNANLQTNNEKDGMQINLLAVFFI